MTLEGARSMALGDLGGLAFPGPPGRPQGGHLLVERPGGYINRSFREAGLVLEH